MMFESAGFEKEFGIYVYERESGREEKLEKHVLGSFWGSAMLAPTTFLRTNYLHLYILSMFVPTTYVRTYYLCLYLPTYLLYLCLSPQIKPGQLKREFEKSKGKFIQHSLRSTVKSIKIAPRYNKLRN